MICTKSGEGPERCAPDPHIASKPVSRVLSFKTAIYLDAPLPARSSHLPGTAGPAICPSTVLLRIEFTAMGSLQPSGELLPRLSTLTSSSAQASYPSLRPKGQSSRIPLRLLSPRKQTLLRGPHLGMRRYFSVALFLGSPPADVIRYPCPMEPGLSS